VLNANAVVGCLVGTAVADALGLPYEGLAPRRALKLLGEPDRHRLFFGRGFVSDDTEHACLVAQALIAAGDDVAAFQRYLASGLRRWFLAVPVGVGLATAKSCVKLCCGLSPDRSGVFSAGNGPAMRAPILGIAIKDRVSLQKYVRASTRMTHTDPKAEWGALAVAVAAQYAISLATVPAGEYLEHVRSMMSGPDADELMGLLERAVASVARRETTPTFADSLGLKNGVSGYMYHTVPVVIHAWLSHSDDYRSAVASVIRCGGDADSTAAIVGGIVGCRVGKEHFPESWVQRLAEWPRTVAWMEKLGMELYRVRHTGMAAQPPRLPWPAVLARNALVFVVVLFHGFRRLLPPY
jgi:ADP-ribosylglycohydrolase